MDQIFATIAMPRNNQTEANSRFDATLVILLVVLFFVHVTYLAGQLSTSNLHSYKLPEVCS